MKYNRFIALILILLIPSCVPSSQKQVTRILAGYVPQSKAPQKAISQATPVITVWVHGTRFFPESMLKKFFYCKEGLNHYTCLNSSYRHHTLCQTLIDSDSDRFTAEDFYLYGWSGALSFKEREKAARKLYLELRTLRDSYLKKSGIEPKIRLIAHSHGGNVSLLLEKIKDANDVAFSIEELIMLATPVQFETKQYAGSPLFKKIYSLYSHFDSLQIIDPQGLQTKGKGAPLFSERRFTQNDKICQCAIKMNNRSILHVEFIKGKFLCLLPHVLNALDTWQKEIILKNEDWHSSERCLNVTIKNVSSKNDWQAF